MAEMSPRETKTLDEICKLKTDHHNVKEGWLMVEEGAVVVVKQRNGEKSTGEVRFSRRSFNALVDWYNRKQKCHKTITEP